MKTAARARGLAAGLGVALTLSGSAVLAAGHRSAHPLPGLDAKAAVPSPDAVAAALTPLLGDYRLGTHLEALVIDASTGQVLLDRAGSEPATPASTVKLAVAAAALEVLGGHSHLTTQVRAAGSVSGGTLHGDLVLVGGGDMALSADPPLPPGAPMPYPELTHIGQLAQGVHDAGIRVVTGRVLADSSLFEGPTTAEGWKASYVPDGVVAPITALEVDEGQPYATPTRPGRVPDPPLTAAQRLQIELVAHGVAVQQDAADGTADGPSVAEVSSAPVALLVERMLTNSDNDLAEALGRLVAIKEGQPATFLGAATAVRAVLERLGVPSTGLELHDVSGLSRNDAVAPATLLALLRLASGDAHPELRPLLTGLPVAGFTGTLQRRYLRGPEVSAAGSVRVKTGSLEGISAVAGLVIDADGRLLLVDLVADQTSGRGAETALDSALATLARCGCH